MLPKPIDYKPSIIYRDVGFYIFSTLLTFAFAGTGVITWWMAVIFLLIYVAYVALTWYQEDYKGNKEETDCDKRGVLNLELENKPNSEKNAICE